MLPILNILNIGHCPSSHPPARFIGILLEPRTWNPEVGSWKLEAGNWKSELGTLESRIGSGTIAIYSSCQPPTTKAHLGTHPLTNQPHGTKKVRASAAYAEAAAATTAAAAGTILPGALQLPGTPPGTPGIPGDTPGTTPGTCTTIAPPAFRWFPTTAAA